MLGKKIPLLLAAACASLWLGGCATRNPLPQMAFQGDLANARAYLAPRIGPAPKNGGTGDINRDYVLDRMRMGVVTLADGYAVPSSMWDDVYKVLRTSGINKDSGAAVVLLSEGVKIWKGEPFEQALGYIYVGLNYGEMGSWDNSRAAFSNSLFQLASVMTGPNGKPLSTAQVVAESKGTDKDGKALAEAKTEATNFALGYLLSGAACKQMQVRNGDPQRGREAEENFAHALKIMPELNDVVARLRDTPSYNVVYVVDYGQGPQKIATGMDHVIADFKPLVASDGRDLQVTVGDASPAISFRQACDVNAMALDHRWNDLQDMRTAKSYIGTGLMVAGAGVAGYGAYNNSTAAMGIGLGMMAIGALAKVSAHADVRYCEVLPQRFYVAPLNITAPGTKVTLQIGGVPSSRMVVTLDPPTGTGAALRYVRLLSPVSESSSEDTIVLAPMPFLPPGWTTSSNVMYSSDAYPYTSGPVFPFILGGRDVSIPSEEALARYQKSGMLTGMTVEQLKHLYMAEGIKTTLQEEKYMPGKHILEGGDSLVCPQNGTLGFARLFSADHPAYKAKSPEVQQLRAQIDAQLRTAAPAAVSASH